tara:strand:+ start:2352 stop:2516 length:165 start_codon:yes stop_codon:yes gene_type:complete
MNKTDLQEKADALTKSLLVGKDVEVQVTVSLIKGSTKIQVSSFTSNKETPKTTK